MIDPDLFLQTNQELKRLSGRFTNLMSTTRASIAGLLMVNEMNKSNYYQQLLDNYQLLLDSGFKRSEFTYFAAYQLLHSKSDEGVQLADEGKAIFEEIHRYHRVLTGREDISMAILLAQFNLEKTPTEIAEITEYYYQELNQIGFKKNSNLHYLAALVTVLYQGENLIFIRQVQEVLNHLKEMNIRLKPIYYVTIGILAFTQGDKTKSMDTEELSNLIKGVQSLSGMRFQKEFSIALGMSLYSEELESGLSSHEMEALLITLQIKLVQEQAATVSASI